MSTPAPAPAEKLGDRLQRAVQRHMEEEQKKREEAERVRKERDELEASKFAAIALGMEEHLLAKAAHGCTTVLSFVDCNCVPSGEGEYEFFWRFANWLQFNQKVEALVLGIEPNGATGGSMARIEFRW